MNKGRHLLISATITLCAVFCAVPRHSTRSSGHSYSRSDIQRLTSNEALALLTVQHLVAAEQAFQSKLGGATNYESLKDLAAVMANRIRDGYRFEITTDLGSSTEPSAFRITASPVKY